MENEDEKNRAYLLSQLPVVENEDEKNRKQLAYCTLAAVIFLMVLSAIGSGSGSKMPKTDKEIEMYLNNDWFEHQK